MKARVLIGMEMLPVDVQARKAMRPVWRGLGGAA
jgi:hypothetical protein